MNGFPLEDINENLRDFKVFFICDFAELHFYILFQGYIDAATRKTKI